MNRNRLEKLALQQVYYYVNPETIGENIVRMTPGQPLSMFWGYKAQGVDPETGLLIYEDLNADGDTCPVSLKEGNMSYVWMADKQTALINQADVTYSSASKGDCSLKWKYSDFKAFGSKKFPVRHQFNITTGATSKKKSINVTIEMNGITADKDWETRTSVSDKYEKVSVEDVLSKIMSL